MKKLSKTAALALTAATTITPTILGAVATFGGDAHAAATTYPTIQSRTPVASNQRMGIDISNWTTSMEWSKWKNAGVKFVIAKATKGSNELNDKRWTEYLGAKNNGLYAGTYHFARPDRSSGAQQADFFIGHGGRWVKDGKTFPGALDLEWNPSGASCYGKTQAQMNSWVNEFVNRYKEVNGVKPIIYTSAGWWNQCVGATKTQSDAILWVPGYKVSTPVIPSTWSGKSWGIFQNTPYDSIGVDVNVFNGTEVDMKNLAILGRL